MCVCMCMCVCACVCVWEGGGTRHTTDHISCLWWWGGGGGVQACVCVCERERDMREGGGLTSWWSDTCGRRPYRSLSAKKRRAERNPEYYQHIHRPYIRGVCVCLFVCACRGITTGGKGCLSPCTGRSTAAAKKRAGLEDFDFANQKEATRHVFFLPNCSARFPISATGTRFCFHAGRPIAEKPEVMPALQ